MTLFAHPTSSPLAAMLGMLFVFVSVMRRGGGGRRALVTVGAARVSATVSGVGVDGQQYGSVMPERVESWWARRQWSKNLDVPYPVGTYREAWAAFPALIRQYHPELNAGITLTQVPPAAEVLLLWECESGHRFAATPTEQRMRPGAGAAAECLVPGMLGRRQPEKGRRPPDAGEGRGAHRTGGPAPAAAAPKGAAVRENPGRPVGTAFVSECAPKPASAVEAQMWAELKRGSR